MESTKVNKMQNPEYMSTPILVWNQQPQLQMKAKDDDELLETEDLGLPVKTESTKSKKSEPAKDDDDDDEELGTNGKKALKTERELRAAAEKDLKAYKEKEEKERKAKMSESERHATEQAEKDAEVSRLRHENLQFKVGAQVEGLSPKMYSRIQGADEAAMLADAKELLKFAPGGTKVPKADPSSGRKTDPSGLSAKDQFTDAVEELFSKE